MTWNLTGTENQQAIVRGAFEKIKFPFEQLRLPGTPELGWRDLNSGTFRVLATGDYAHVEEHEGHHHEDEGENAHHPEGDDEPEPLMGRFGAERNYILGVFYPGSARIYIDLALENYPEIAQSVVSAEIAHAVDEFLPLTEGQRQEIMAALHGGVPDEHTWWEKIDYGAEYYSLVGETFMILFTKAYSDIPFGNAGDFVHGGENVSAGTIRAIIGIPRTDEIRLVRYGKSKIYHKPGHRVSKKDPLPVIDTSGLRACKVCKPNG